jgi:amino acid permease
VTEGGAMFSRGELLAGMSARRATTLLFAIEARTAHLVARSRRALATFETERTAAEREQAFLQALAGARESGVSARIQDLERYAGSWSQLVPGDPELRASVLRRIADKHGLPAGRVPRILAALGVDDPEVQAAYLRQTGSPIAMASTPVGGYRDRLRWARAGAAERLEALPPFWIAFAITLTETIAEGILAVPIAVAGIGPVAGIALLLGLGLVNVITIAAIVEAISRTGRMRYGEAYLGSLVSEHIGRNGAVLFGAVLFVGGLVELLAYSLGFAYQLGDATGIAPTAWIAVLLVVNVAILWRGTLDATVATALAIGAVNIILILAICAIGLTHLDVARLQSTGTAGQGIGPLALAAGVIFLAYFGHASTANTAKVVLRADPTGRSLLGGSVAAMVVVIALLVLGVVAINGAVPADRLASETGTAFTPLAEVAGPAVSVLGSVYTILAIGLGSIYCSLALYNQVREQLPTAASGMAGPASGLRRVAIHPRGRWLIAMAPTILSFVAIEAIVVLGDGSFVESLGVVGTLTVPLLAGVFPMLLFAAARRRGELVPTPALRVIDHPLVVGVMTTLFTTAILVYGTSIWDDLPRRILALAIGGATAVVAVMAVVRGAFRPRAVVELRVDGEQVRTVRISLVVDGHARRVDATWTGRGGGTQDVEAGGGSRRVDDVAAVDVPLPPGHPPELRVWSHVVGGDDESSPWPATVRIVGGPDVTRVLPMDEDGVGDSEDAGGIGSVVVALGG